MDQRRHVRLGGLAALAAIVALAGCGQPNGSRASARAGLIAPAAPPTTRWAQVATVTCADLGSVTIGLPSGLAVPPPPSGVELRVAVTATDANTGKAVSGGAAPGEISCGAVPFADLAAEQAFPPGLPAGVAPGDRLTGQWVVSAQVTLAPNPTVP